MRWRHLLMIPVCLTLGGCLGASDLRLSRLWGAAPPSAPATETAPPTPYYCYRNIGRVDCYVAPDPQRRQ